MSLVKYRVIFLQPFKIVYKVDGFTAHSTNIVGWGLLVDVEGHSIGQVFFKIYIYAN